MFVPAFVCHTFSNPQVVLAETLRRVASPLLAGVTVGSFGSTGVSRAAGVLQPGMSAAVPASTVSVEGGVAPLFVTSVVFFSTPCSLPTLALPLSLV